MQVSTKDIIFRKSKMRKLLFASMKAGKCFLPYRDGGEIGLQVSELR